MKYRWIYNQCTKVNGKEYPFFAVIVNGKYLYTSSVLEYCEEYVLKYAQKHGINYSDILRNGKHKRIKIKK